MNSQLGALLKQAFKANGEINGPFPINLKLEINDGGGWLDDCGWSMDHDKIVDEWASSILPCRIVDEAGKVHAEHKGRHQ